MQNRLNRFHWTTSERTIGRMLRNPEADHVGAPPGFTPDGGGSQQQQSGANQQQDGNNQSVIPGQESSQSNQKDNTGDEGWDATKFWQDEPAGEAAPSPRDSVVTKPAGSSASDSDDSKNNIGAQLMAEIDSTQFGEVFNKDMAQQLAEGDFKGANEAVTKNLQTAMKSSLRHNAKLLGEYGKMMLRNIESIIDDRIGQQVNSDYLVEKIPAASNPKVGPAIRDIYERALVRTKGNREQAVEQTKSMMRTLTTELAGDLDLTVAPHDPHSDRATTKSTNWLEELASR